jgi:hypothetical protein
MPESYEQLIVAAYFEHFKTNNPELLWAWDEVHVIARPDAEKSWPLVLALINAAPDDVSLAYVGSGPLEDLLADHGEIAIDRVMDAAAHQPRFRQALAGVYRVRLSDAVWERIASLGPLCTCSGPVQQPSSGNEDHGP